MKLVILAAIASLGWTWESTEWNKGVKVQNVAGGFAFNFPVCDSHVNAIQTDRPPIALNKTIVVRYKIVPVSGTPKFISLDPAPVPPSLKPNFRPMLQVANDDYMTEDNRWWPAGANCGFLVADGLEHELRFAVKPALWTNVYGKPASQRASAFKSVISHSGKLNIAFGGGNSFSHGVCQKGGVVRFKLLSVTIQ